MGSKPIPLARNWKGLANLRGRETFVHYPKLSDWWLSNRCDFLSVRQGIFRHTSVDFCKRTLHEDAFLVMRQWWFPCTFPWMWCFHFFFCSCRETASVISSRISCSRYYPFHTDHTAIIIIAIFFSWLAILLLSWSDRQCTDFKERITLTDCVDAVTTFFSSWAYLDFMHLSIL